jgi:hypothetical protein
MNVFLYLISYKKNPSITLGRDPWAADKKWTLESAQLVVDSFTILLVFNGL